MTKKSSESVVNYRLVGPQNVLWTCHKACNIEYEDCCFCVCSTCYSNLTTDTETKNKQKEHSVRKRRRVSRSLDDDTTVCNHNVDRLVPFMDATFFTKKYKQTIRLEKYKLPMFCSRCENELVDKVEKGKKSNLINDIII